MCFNFPGCELVEHSTSLCFLIRSAFVPLSTGSHQSGRYPCSPRLRNEQQKGGMGFVNAEPAQTGRVLFLTRQGVVLQRQRNKTASPAAEACAEEKNVANYT